MEVLPGPAPMTMSGMAKREMLDRWSEDHNIEQVMIIGRTMDGRFVLENTQFDDLYGVLGFVQVKLLGLIGG